MTHPWGHLKRSVSTLDDSLYRMTPTPKKEFSSYSGGAVFSTGVKSNQIYRGPKAIEEQTTWARV